MSYETRYAAMKWQAAEDRANTPAAIAERFQHAAAIEQVKAEMLAQFGELNLDGLSLDAMIEAARARDEFRAKRLAEVRAELAKTPIENWLPKKPARGRR